MKKKDSKINWEAMDDIIFVPKKNNYTWLKIMISTVFLITVGLGVYQFILGREFPKEKLIFSTDTRIYCSDRSVPVGGSVINTPNWWLNSELYRQFNYENSVKTDFVGKIKNEYWLPAKNVKLGVRIQGISNPDAKWWMGTTTIKEIPPNSSVEFSARLNHNCVQHDIQWKYVVIEASY